MNPNRLEIRRWFERHAHVRDGDLLKKVLPSTINQHATGAVIMGNLPEPTSTIERTRAYRDRIKAHIPTDSDFVPYMTAYLTDGISPEEIVRGHQEGVWCAVKLYMAKQDGTGGTTGSSHGVRDLRKRDKVFAAMEKHRIPLLGHFEAVEDRVDEFDREIVSVERDVEWLVKSFPGLPIVFEHITDGRAADYVAEVDHEMYATITAHHPMINRNALFKDGLNPGHWCKPVPKREVHRAKVRYHMTSGSPRFGAGTDTAPHDESVKSLCYGCAAGIFTAVSAVELYTTMFEEDGKLEHLEAFLSENFLHIYGMEVSNEIMVLERRPFVIPQKVGNVQVFMGGQTLPWKLVS